MSFIAAFGWLFLCHNLIVMARIKEEDLRLNIIVNGDKGRSEMLSINKTIAETKAKLSAVNSELKQLDGKIPENKERIRRLKEEQKGYNKAIADAKQKQQGLIGSMNVSKLTMAELGKRINSTKIALRHAVPGTDNWKRLNRELRIARTRMNELSEQSKATRGVLGGLSRIRMGFIGSIAAVAGFIRGIGSTIAKLSQFEQANANLATIIGKPVKELKHLTDSALALGRTTEYTGSQVTNLQTELAKLGFKDWAIIGMQKDVLRFATAVGANLTDAAALAGSTLRIFNLKSKDTEDALGSLAVATNNSALDFSFLQTSMSIVGPVAKAFGFSVKDTVALLGTLANAGFDASSAATAARNIFLNLADANGKLAKALGGPVRTFPELMSGLEKLNSQGIDLATTLELTDKRSVAAFNSFLSGVDSARELRGALENVNGELERISTERLDTVEGSVKLLQSAWEGFILSMSNSKGAIKKVIDFLTESVQGATLTLFRSARVQLTADTYKAQFEKIYKEQGADAAESWIKSVLDKRQKEVEKAEKAAKRDPFLNKIFGFGGQQGKAKKSREAFDGVKSAAESILGQIANDKSEGSGVNLSKSQNSTDNVYNKTKSVHGWSLSSDREYLEAKASLTRKYNDGEIADKEELERQLYELEISTYKARLASMKGSADERAKIASEMQDRILKRQEDTKKKSEALSKEGAEIIASAEDDKQKAAAIAEELRYEAEKKKFSEQKIAYKNQAAVIEAIEKKHQNNLRKIRLDADNKELSDQEKAYKIKREEIISKYANEISDLRSTNKGGKAIMQQNRDVALAKLDYDYLLKLKEHLEKTLNEGAIDGSILTSEQTQDIQLKLEQIKTKIAETEASLKKKSTGLAGGIGGGSLFGVSQEEWEKFFTATDAAEDKAKKVGTALNAIGGMAQEGFKLASQAISLTNAKENEAFKKYQKDNERKKKSLKDRLDDGLMTEAQYKAEIAAMEEEEQARQEELRLKQAERQKKMDIVQAVINTALSVTKTFAQWGWPQGIAPAAIAGALGAAQVAMIAAQPVSGAEEGGFIDTVRKQDGKHFKARLSPDKRGFVNMPTVLVGENGGEYVIPSDGLDNPSLRPFIRTIESARKAGTLKRLNFDAVYPISSSVGRAVGGYTSPYENRLPSSEVQAFSQHSDKKLLDAIELLNKRLSQPIIAEVSMLGHKGIIEQTEKYNRAKERGYYG